MFQVLVLVCSIGVAPMDCQTDTAIETIRGPEAANEIQCGLYGQATSRRWASMHCATANT